MGNSELPAAGWYPAAHANGEARWWDGTRWSDVDAAATPVTDTDADGTVTDADGTATAVHGTATAVYGTAAAAHGTAAAAHVTATAVHDTATSTGGLAEPTASDDAGPARPPASMRRRTGAVLAGSALIVGLLVGAATGGAGSSGERDTLKAQVSALEVEVANAESSAASAETVADAARADLQSAQARATTAEQKLTEANAKVTTLEAAAVTAKADLDARAAEIADLKTKVPSSTAPAPSAPVQSTPVQEATTPQNVSYANCTEARNAGAAPVRRGDPGYSSRLDRDGDGIGCE